MNYEQRYNDALARAKKFYNDEGCRVGMTPVDLEVIFPELKESEDERIRKQIISFLKEFEHDHYRCLDFSSWITWLEKQGEQKSVDNVEPRFKVGDLVVTDKGDTVQIKTINNDYYTIGNGMFVNIPYVDKYWHKWTNQDIKDGDILCTYECGKPKIVFIFKGAPMTYHILKYYCYYNIMYPYFEPDAETGCLAVNDGDLKPATKEQRDLLFQKMKESN